MSYPLSRKMPELCRPQSGATLIVVLVILVAMTFLGLGSMSDNNLQLAMVRNSQLQTGAYTAALTEINAQLDAINTNAVTDDDAAILALVQSPTTTTNGIESRFIDFADIDLLLPTVLGATDASYYTTSLRITEPDANTFLPITGMSLSPDSTVKWIVMNFNSQATIDNTSTSSNQVQGFKYLSAN